MREGDGGKRKGGRERHEKGGRSGRREGKRKGGNEGGREGGREGLSVPLEQVPVELCAGLVHVQLPAPGLDRVPVHLRRRKREGGREGGRGE